MEKKNSKKYLKSEKYKKLPMMVEKQETKILKRYHIKIFFSKLKFIQFLLNLATIPQIMKI
jgi:hypothetical protein